MDRIFPQVVNILAMVRILLQYHALFEESESLPAQSNNIDSKLTLINSSKLREKVVIVDFCGGTGHVALPLARMLGNNCEVWIVDKSLVSLKIAGT